MQTLTLKAVKAAGRAAYEAGTLTAQSDTPRCAYSLEDGSRCVIGAALNADTIADIEKQYAQGSTVAQLARAEIVKVGIKSLKQLTELQVKHDDWCKAQQPYSYNGLPPVDVAEAEFVALLYKE